jgi:GntR family transcriptional regulator
MFFKVDVSSSKPVYLQLIDQVKFAVASGRLKPDDRLPPIRDVSVQVRVNRNTVARVYAELEREGIIYSRAGQGCFVSDRGSALTNAEKRRQILGRLDDLLAQAKLFGIARKQMRDLFLERLDAVYQASS